MAIVKGMDIPIVKLTPIRKRTISTKGYAKLHANILAVGLIEPLCICKDEDQFFILDGYVRYKVLLELGVETVPCLILDSKDIYTPNRQVNHMSPQQEVKMLRKALENLDENTIAAAFGMESLGTRLKAWMQKELHPQVLKDLDAGQISQDVARELTYVIPKRQVEIVEFMREAKDWSMAFARTQVLRTPTPLRTKKKRSTPWERQEEKKRNLMKKLQEVEKHHDFYSSLYRQYVGDLLKLAVYVRQLLTRPAIQKYLATKHPETLKLFESIIQESDGKAAV